MSKHTIEDYNKFLDTKVGGEKGSLASITLASGFFLDNPDLRPDVRGQKQSKGEAVANYGGMIVAHYGWTAETVYPFADLIGAKYTKLDTRWGLDEAEFTAFLIELQHAYSEELDKEAVLEASIGKPAESAIKGSLNKFNEFKVIATSPQGHVTRATLLQATELRDGLNEVIALLEKRTGASYITHTVPDTDLVGVE